MSFPHGTVFHPQMALSSAAGGVVYPGQLQAHPQPQQRAVVSTTTAPMNMMAAAPAVAAMGQPTFVYQEFKCHLCEFRALRQADVELHKRSVHNGQRLVRDELCESKACGNGSMAHCKVDCKKNRPFPCDQCGTAFVQKSHLDTHAKTVHGAGDKPFRCTICQYQCTSKASLDKHIHLVHKKERPFACQVCQRRFGQKVHLNVHMNAVHLKDRPYHCDECGYSAATKGLVQKHVSTVHRKEKPFACEICSSRFGQKVHMQKHVITVHMKEKPYKCDQCTYQTSSRGTLDRHIGVVHKGSKSYECQVCAASFGQKSHLNKHIQNGCGASPMVKNVIQPFKCVECPMNFANMNDLRQHLSTNHIKVINGVQIQLKIPQYYNP